MTRSLLPVVADILREIAVEKVLPRYQALASGDIEEKAPGDLVTVADHDVEIALAHRLGALMPDARFVGEERCARDPGLLAGLDQGLVWVVDPIDGTGNFAAGRPPFAIMVALLRDGVTVAAWIHDPLTGRMAQAELGGGTWIDGRRLQAAAAAPALAALHGIVSRFAMPEAMVEPVAALERAIGQATPTQRCAGHEYPVVALGERDFALYWRTLVWDHAAGALILAEAGGVVERLDGTPYRPGSTETGLLLAHNAATAEIVRSLLRGRGAAIQAIDS
ncbi:MAG: inositol monophosphatase family protein [Sphingomonas sp.]